MLGFFLLLSGTGKSHAGLLITSRAALGGTDFIDWGTPASLPSSFSINSNGSVAVTVSGGSVFSDYTDNGISNWDGSFALGDHVLYNHGGGAVTLDFGSNLISRGGLQVDPAEYGAFVARVTTCDSGNNLLDSFTEAGFGAFL